MLINEYRQRLLGIAINMLDRFSKRRFHSARPVVLTLTASAVIFVLLIMPIPHLAASHRWHLLLSALEDLGHPAAFAVLGTLAIRAWPVAATRAAHWRRALCIMAAALLFGGGAELLQSLTGRDPSMTDVLGDLLGSVAAILFRVARTRGEFTLGLRGAATAVLFLVLATIMTPLTATAGSYIARSRVFPLIWEPDSIWLRRFAQLHRGPYPGLAILEPMPDWSAYDSLIVELHCLGSTPLVVNVRVHDRHHDDSYSDRFNMRYEVTPGRRHRLRIPLSEIANAPAQRSMDMHAIDGLTIFLRQPGVDITRVLSIDAIRLAPALPEQ